MDFFHGIIRCGSQDHKSSFILKPAPLKKQYEEMHKIGVNINQITKKGNFHSNLQYK